MGIFGLVVGVVGWVEVEVEEGLVVSDLLVLGGGLDEVVLRALDDL